jgi:hypothetical protein
MTSQEDTRDFIRFIHTVLSSLRRTLERPFEAQLRQNDTEGAHLLREILRDLESARLSISPLRVSVTGHSVEKIVLYLSALSRELARIAENPQYTSLLRSIRYRRLREFDPAGQPPKYPDFDSGSAYDAIQSLIDRIAYYAAPDVSGDAQSELFRLRSIVPPQKIAPAQFEIKNHRLVLRKNPSTSKAEDARNIASAKSELQRNGDRIIEELERSNCDKRLLQNIQHLQSQLLDETDAIKIGITNLSCEFMCSAFDQELPSAVSSMLKAHTRGVQLFIGQFPEWSKFLENAATAHLENEDVEALRNASIEIIETLKAQPNVVDPEVPRTLSYLTQLLESPSATAKKAAFAVLRSLENFISLAFNYGAEFGQKTISKTIDGASSAASKIIIAALLTMALSSATSIGPIASKLPEMNWLQTASDIVRKQLEKLLSEK